jgi:hypothetical protein
MRQHLQSHLTFANITSLLALVVALGGSAYAAGFVGSGGQIHGCVGKHGQLTVLRSGQHCGKGQSTIAWNQQGTEGPRGLTGAPGQNGPNGTPGLNGTNGGNAATNVVVRSNKTETGFVKVQCNPGEKVTGGGGYAHEGFAGTQPEYTTEGGPPTGWKTYGKAGSEIYAYVVCASP